MIDDAGAIFAAFIKINLIRFGQYSSPGKFLFKKISI